MHLCSKTDIPSTFHHQQDLNLVVTLGMCGDSWGKRLTGCRKCTQQRRAQRQEQYDVH